MPFGEDARTVDLIFGLALLATLFMLARQWRTFWDDDFSPEDRRLATQLAVFAVPPLVVLVHELGHVAAARLVGGRVLDFHYGLIEGSVRVGGRLNAGELWLIALAGNVVGSVLGLAMVGAGAFAVRLPRPLRRILILGGLLEVGHQLVLYPLLSLSAQFGDWVGIYDFDATPALSTATAVVHVAVLVALWLWWRDRGRRTLFNVDHGLDADVTRLEKAMAATPQNPDAAIELAVLYARNGQMALARQTLDIAARMPGMDGPDTARLALIRARVAVIEERWNQAYVAAREGLDAVGDDDRSEIGQRLWANVGLALWSIHRPDHALAAFDRLSPPVSEDPRVVYARGLARLSRGQRAEGEADLRSVVGWRPEGDLLRQWAEAQLEGREPPPPDDRDRPNYARRTKAPPAPLAGV